MADPAGGKTAYRFKGWELRPAQSVLLVAGVPRSLPSLAFDVLTLLAEHWPGVISKEFILDKVWPRTTILDGGVAVRIHAIRQVLGKSAVVTVKGLGYRLEAERMPEPEALVGREADVRELLALLDRSRLVSITGPGGVGKTALARQLLATGSLGDATCWVDLSLRASDKDLWAAVAEGIGVIDSGGDRSANLLAALSRMSATIVLDNCEHLAEAVSHLIQAALDAAPAVRWFVTSQAPLQLPDEQVYPLPPLHVPSDDAPLEQARGSGALTMLCNLVGTARDPFVLTPGNLQAAIDICRELDGLPLFIQMVASRIATLGLETVREQLRQKLRLDSEGPGVPARQQKMRRVFDWSYGLLDATEKRTFLLLQPFVGGFSKHAVRQMLYGPTGPYSEAQEWDASDALHRLVLRSFVRKSADGGGEGRYLLYESGRAYGLALLREAGELDFVRHRHAETVAAHFARARANHDDWGDAQWASEYPVERYNVRAALDCATVTRQPALLARLAAALALIDTFTRAQAEIVRCQVPADVLLQADLRSRAWSCAELSWAHFLDGDRQVATRLASQAVQDYRALGDVAGTYQALAQLVRLYESQPSMAEEARAAATELAAIDLRGVPERSRLFCAITGGMQYSGERTLSRLHELHEETRERGYDTLAALCRVHITDQLLIERKYVDAVETARQFHADGETRARPRAMILVNLIQALAQLNRRKEGLEPAGIVLRTLPSAANHVIAAFALAATREGKLERAARMMGYCQRIRRERNQRPDPAEEVLEGEVRDTLSEKLPAQKLHTLLDEGASLTLAKAWLLIDW